MAGELGRTDLVDVSSRLLEARSMPSLDEFNDIVQSLWKGGTRFETEKRIVAATYGVIVVLTVAWVVTGIELGAELEGEFATEGTSTLGGETFIVRNTGSTAWHDVRIVINDRYLATLEELPGEKEERLEAPDFANYYYVPRPWGHEIWERIGSRGKPGRFVPDDVDIETVTARSREGRIEMRVEEGS